jgi:hypothetical protein
LNLEPCTFLPSAVAEAKQIDSLSVETLLLVLDTVGLTMEFKSA